jgi:hypothetical protein
LVRDGTQKQGAAPLADDVAQSRDAGGPRQRIEGERIRHIRRVKVDRIGYAVWRDQAQHSLHQVTMWIEGREALLGV